MITPVAKRQNSKLLYSNAASMIWLLALRTDTTTLYVTMLHIYTFTHCLHYKVKSNPSSVVEQICSLETWSLCIYYYTNPLLTTSANNNTLKLYPQIIQVVAERKNVNREIWMLFKLSKTGQVKMLDYYNINFCRKSIIDWKETYELVGNKTVNCKCYHVESIHRHHTVCSWV